jgi:hypothetical protein
MTIKKYKSSQFSQRFIRVILDIIIGWSVIWKSYRYFVVFKGLGLTISTNFEQLQGL